MQVNATQIREGMILVIDGELYRVTWKMHRTPGKGNACMQTKLKNIVSGRNLEKRFLSSERVEKAELNTIEMQYLYNDPDGYHFMNLETFDQIHIPNDILEDSSKYLKEEIIYPITFFEGKIVGLELPLTMELLVTTAPPEIKRATVTNSLRPVTLENEMTVLAPGFIKEGDKVRINTETGEYLERVK